MSNMTETLTTPYSSSTFNTVADIEPQHSAFAKRDGVAFINENICALIKKHKLQEIFGVALTHRHFSVDSHEKLVLDGNTTSPWPGMHVGLNKFLGHDSHLIYETSWMLDPNSHRWMAYEFGFSPIQGWDLGCDKICVDIDDPKYVTFLTEYASLLKENGWDKLLGLTLCPDKGFKGAIEFTEGRSNITIDLDHCEIEFDDLRFNFWQTDWYFAPGIIQVPGCKTTRCAKYCATGRHGGHVGEAHRRY